MKDLIERQAAIGAVKEYFKFSPLEGRQCAKAIERVPSVQPDKDLIHLQKEQAYMQGYEDGRKPRKGKWRRRLVDCGFNADWHCSECGWKTSIEEHGYNFCPNCGADMRSEAREYLEYGKLIAKGIAQGLRGDSE